MDVPPSHVSPRPPVRMNTQRLSSSTTPANTQSAQRPSSSSSDSSGALTPYPRHARSWSLKAFLKIAYPRGTWDPRPLSGLTPRRLSNASPSSTTPPTSPTRAVESPKLASLLPRSTPSLPSWITKRVSSTRHRKSSSTASASTSTSAAAPAAAPTTSSWASTASKASKASKASSSNTATTLPQLVDHPDPCGFLAMMRFLYDVLEQPSRQLDPFVRFLEYQSLVLVLQKNMKAVDMSPFADPSDANGNANGHGGNNNNNRADRSSKEATIAAAAKAVERGLEKCGLEIPPLVKETAERWSRQAWIGPVEAEAIWLMALLTIMTDHLRNETRVSDVDWDAWGGETSRSGSLDMPEQDLITFL